jgi:hypothetical protein
MAASGLADVHRDCHRDARYNDDMRRTAILILFVSLSLSAAAPKKKPVN